MSDNKISISGPSKLFTWLADKLKTQEEKELLDAQARKMHAEAATIESQQLLEQLEKIAETKKKEIGALKEAIALYKEMGFTEGQIQSYIGEKLQNVLEVYDAVQVLLNLKERGVILNAKIKELNSSADTEE